MIYYDILNEACREIGITFNEEMYTKFMVYKDLIKVWNEKVNLTSITDDEEIVKKHFIDSIKIFTFQGAKDAEKIIDIGTGGGFPGIPMKIVCPSLEVVLLDSLNKRVKFLDVVIEKLSLDKISTIHGRAEDFAVNKEYREKFDIVVSRAVANMSVLSELCIPYVKLGSYFIALKGPALDSELKDSYGPISKLGGSIYKIIPVKIEGSDLNHNLVVVNKVKTTPLKYPRKAGIIKKVPLK